MLDITVKSHVCYSLGIIKQSQVPEFIFNVKGLFDYKEQVLKVWNNLKINKSMEAYTL